MKTPLRDIMAVAVLLTVGSFASAASSQAINLTLTSDNIDSSTAVVNSASSSVHPPVQVDGWDDDFVAPTHTTVFSVGDGRHGSFNATTMFNFIDGTYNNDFILHINTDTYPDLQFTDFTLPTGYQIVPTGSRPLVIRSLSTVTINGTIACNGGDGGDIGSAAVPLGGTARCGGNAGGNGGTAVLAATAGTAPATNAAAVGGAGASQGDGDGGGGGAGMDQTAPGATAGINGGLVAGGAGAAGTAGNDSSFATEGGGAGGGGGAAFTDASDPAGASSGAGGGAGGGSVYIYSVGNQVVAGTVTANGGNGGGGVAPAKGGGGGGGAGGSVLMYSAGSIQINGFVSADPGNGGVSPGGDGGAGGSGRTWVTDNDGVPTVAAFNSLEPLGILPTWGTVDYQVGTTSVITKQIDLDNTAPVLSNIAATVAGAAGNSYTVDVATSDSPFAVADAVWVSSTAVEGKAVKRYVRLKLTLSNQVATAPISATQISFTYVKSDQSNFDFASCQSGTVGAPPSGGTRLLTLFLLLLPLVAAFGLRDRRRAYQPTPR